MEKINSAMANKSPEKKDIIKICFSFLSVFVIYMLSNFEFRIGLSPFEIGLYDKT